MTTTTTITRGKPAEVPWQVFGGAPLAGLALPGNVSFRFSEFCRCVGDAAGWLAHWLTALLTTVYKRNVMQNRGKSITACHLANQHNSSATTSLAQMEKLEKF